MLNKIACSYYNAAAISEEEDLYIWGSINSGLFDPGKGKAQEIPRKFSFDELNPFFKALQVSLGPNHAAVLVGNKFLNKTEPVNYIDPIHQSILEKQAEYLKESEIDPIVEYNLAKNTFVAKEEFLKILNSFECEYTEREEEEIISSNFVDFFVSKNGVYVNLIQFFYLLNKDLFTSNRVITWGISENGRLGHNKPDGLPRSATIIKAKDSLLDVETSLSNPETLAMIKRSYQPPDFVCIPTAIKKVCCGHQFTIALDELGTVWSWGKGSNGCLGTGDLEDCWEPKSIPRKNFSVNPTEQTMVDIAAGSEHCMAFNQCNQIFSWGTGRMGRLGHGNETSCLVPTKIAFFANKGVKVKSIACGELHSAAIVDNYEVYTWGCGANFRLGHGASNNELTPRLVIAISELYTKQISLGASHSLCLTTDGHVYSWGSGKSGRLGIDMVSDKDYLVPTRVGLVNESFKKKEFEEIFAGPFQTFAVTHEGELYVWGSKKFWTLGLIDLKRDVYFPASVEYVKCYHKARKEKGKKKSGATGRSSLPLGGVQFDAYDLQFQNEIHPTFDPFHVAKIFAGESNTAFLMCNGDLYITGSGNHGQLGLNPDSAKEDAEDLDLGTNLFWQADLFYSYTPLYLSVNLTVKFKHIAVGLNHIAAIDSSGNAYSWGGNSEGQLGIGTLTKFVNKPTLIEEITLKEFKMCIASHTYSAFLSVDGEVFVCGTSEYGCLGVNNLKQNYDVLTPKMINDIPPVKFLAGAPQHMVAITLDDDVMVWGNHNNGRIGLGPKNEKVLTPRAVKINNAQGPVKFRQASCGFMHTLLLDVEGHIWGAGARAYAGFPSDDGYRTLEDQDIFKPLPDLMRIKFIQISSGEFHNLALTEDNLVYGWGKSEYGKLAQDTFLSYGSPDTKLQNIILPKRIEDLDNITEVSCGVNHSACLNDEGDVFIWGCTLSGRLGIAREDLRLLKHQRQVKAERNVLVLSTPKSLQTYFSDEFDNKLRLYTKESKKDFLGLQQGVSKIASQLLKAIDEAYQAEIEKEKPTNDTYANAETRKLLAKKGGEKSPISAKRRGLLAFYENTLSSGLLNPATRATTTEITAKKWLSPDTVDAYHDSPLLSETNKIKPFNPPHASRFSITVQPVESANPTASAKQKSPSPRKSAIATPKGSAGRRTIGNASLMNFGEERVENSKGQLLIQYFLQEEESDHFEITLNARDLDISESFERVFTKVSQVIEKLKKGMSRVVVETGSMIETSFEISEEKHQKIKNLAHTIPSFILQNIQIYEGIVSMMFLHPCYFHKMLKSELIDPNMVMDWAFKIYGTHNEDDRVINQMLALGLMILEDEVEQYPIHQQGVVKMRSHFVKVYNFIQTQQRENMNFIKEIVQFLLINVVIKDYYPGFNAARNRELEGLIQQNINEDDPLLTGDFIEEIELEKYENEPIDELFDLEYYIKHRDESNKPKAQRVMRRCLGFIKKFEVYIKSILSRPDFSVMGKISPQLRYFASRILQEYKNTIKIDPFDPRLQGNVNEASVVTKRTEFFLIDLFFGKVADVLFNYKDYGIRIPKEYQDILSPQNLSGLALVITKYLEKEQISTGQYFTPINDYISVNSKSTFIINPLVRGLINHDDYDLTLDNILKTLDDSMKIRDRYVSKLSVKDIINIQNFLIKNRSKMQIFIRGADDPMSIMTEYLKDNHLNLSSFAFEMLEYRVNLKILTNIMEKQVGTDNLKVHRCNFCQLVFPEYLLRVEDVNLIKENGWSCHNPKCSGRRNSYSKQTCDTCGSLVQEYKYQRTFIFKRYLPLIRKDKSLLAYFQFIKGAHKIMENADISGLIKDKIELSIKQELFELAGLYSHMLGNFERFDFKTLTKDYKMNLEPFSPDDGVNKAISILNDIFCDEFQIRRTHKRYLDRLDSLLVRLNQLVVNEDHKFAKIAKSIERIGLEVALTRGRYNGVNSGILNKAGQAEEEEMSRKMQSDSVKPYNMFNSEDLKEQKVLANFLLHGKSVPKIVNNLKFNIFYRPEIGFNIKIVFVEDSWRNLLVRFVQRLYTNEVALEEIQISPQHFLELKRTINYKAETTIGYATFYVENLVNLLNSVLTKSNTRKIGYDPSRERSKRKEQEKLEKKKAKSKK